MLPQPFRICVKRASPIRPPVVSPRAHGSGASETPGSNNTAEWQGRPWPPPPPPLPRRLQAQLQEETFGKDTSANQPSQRLTTQHPKAKPSANKRRRRPQDPQTGKYKRSNKRSAKALEKRELRKRIHRLRKEACEEQEQTQASSSKQQNENKGQVKRKESPDPSSHQTQSDTSTSGSETVESDSSSICVVAPAHRRGEPRP